MRDGDLLKRQAGLAFDELIGSIEGVTEHEAWARVECRPGEYMHTEGSILSNVVHVAAGKLLYGSAAYRSLEIRWRDTVARMESFWPSWEEAKRYLHEAQAYWLETWSEETDLERPVATFSGKEWPSWKVITTVSHHDGYHAGQIQVLRSTLPPAEAPPPDEGDLWRKYCEPLPSW